MANDKGKGSDKGLGIGTADFGEHVFPRKPGKVIISIESDSPKIKNIPTVQRSEPAPKGPPKRDK